MIPYIIRILLPALGFLREPVRLKFEAEFGTELGVEVQEVEAACGI